VTHPIAVIAEAVRERIRGDGIDLAGDGALVHGYVREEVRRYSERALGSTVPLIADEAAVTRQVMHARLRALEPAPSTYLVVSSS
jgi:pilus assembly protein CpaF